MGVERSGMTIEAVGLDEMAQAGCEPKLRGPRTEP